jgi:hypothetical protein
MPAPCEHRCVILEGGDVILEGGDRNEGAMAETSAQSPQPAMLTVPLDSEPARVLADQAAIIADLQFVMDCCKRLLAELSKPEEEWDTVVPQALWSAAVVAYARCFGKGKRSGLTTEDVHALPLHGAVMKYHQWIIKERGKLANHPANPFEMAKVGAVLSPPDEAKRKVEGIAILSNSHVLVDDIGVRQLGGLASELAKRTAEKAQAQQDQVLADAQKQSLDTLYRTEPLRAGP